MKIAILLSLCVVFSHAAIEFMTPTFAHATENQNSLQKITLKNGNTFVINGYHSNTVRNVTLRILDPLQRATISPSGAQRLGSISAGSYADVDFTINGPSGKYELVFEVNYKDENNRFQILIKNYELDISKSSRDVNSIEQENTLELSKRTDPSCVAGTSTSGSGSDIVSTYCSFSGDLNDYTKNSWLFTVASGITFTSFSYNIITNGQQVQGPYNRTLTPGTMGGTLSNVNQRADFQEYGVVCGNYPLRLQATYRKGTTGPLYTWHADQTISITPVTGLACTCAGTCRRDASEGRIMPLEN